MLKAKRMQKLTLVCSQARLADVVRTLHSLGAVHIRKHKKDELDIGEPFPEAEQTSSLLNRTESLIAQLAAPRKDYQKLRRNLAEDEAEVARIEQAHQDKQQKISLLEAERAEIRKLRDVLERIAPLGLHVEQLSGYGSLAVFVGTLKKELASQKVHAITKDSALMQKENILALFMRKGKEEQIAKLLQSHGFQQIDLSALAGKKGSPSELQRSAAQQLEDVEKRMALARKYITFMGEKHAKFLLSLREHLAEALEKAEAPLQFAKSDFAYLVTGFAPKEKISLIREQLEKATRNSIHLMISEPGKHDNVPIELDNPRGAKPFEFFLDLYALPRYQEIDPSLFMALTFPLFFGIILGDFGYGAVCLLLFLWLRSRFPKAKSLMNIFIYSSLGSIVFGFAFGEFFGYEELFGYAIPRLLSRVNQIDLLMGFAVAVGVVHVNWGVLAGFANELRSHGFVHAANAKLSWIVLEAGVALLALSLTGILSLHWGLGAALLALAVIMLYKGEGIPGLVEIPGIFSNILSYLRLMAVGMASVMLAVVVNQFAGEFAAGGGAMIAAGVLVFVIGHTINIALGILGGGLHSLRLEYVEFFTKFYKGGGERFKPFGAKG